MAKTALQTAIQGGKVSDKQAQGALAHAAGRISGLAKKASASRDAMVETGAQLVHTAETQGSLFLASLGEGYFGTQKLRVGGVDVRAPVAFLAQGYGLYQTLKGDRGGGGAHALALGNGVLGSWLASVGVQAGRTLAEKRVGGGAKGAAAEPTAPGQTPAVQGEEMRAPATREAEVLPPEAAWQGPVREVMLTPPPEPDLADDDDRAERRRRHRHSRVRDRRRSRFLRAA
jgi:hypothetical protein